MHNHFIYVNLVFIDENKLFISLSQFKQAFKKFSRFAFLYPQKKMGGI